MNSDSTSPERHAELPHFLSTGEVGKLLGKKTHAVRRMCKNIPGAYQERAGGDWKIPLTSLRQSPYNVSEQRFTKLFATKPPDFPLVLNPQATDNARDKETSTSSSMRRRWPHNKFDWGILITGIVLFAAVISLAADFGGARQQAIRWGFLPEFRSRQSGEILVIVAQFYYPDNVVNTAAHNEVRSRITSEAIGLGLNNLRIEVSTIQLESDQVDKASRLGKRYNADLIIWGTDTSVRTTVNFLNLMNPCFCAAEVTLTEIERSQLRNPPAYTQFITEDLPGQLSFLTLFAVADLIDHEQGAVAAIPVLERAIKLLPADSMIKGIE